MDVIISTLAVFWLILAIFFILIKKGLWIFSDVSKSLSMFMLEKALGPAIDFVSGRPRICNNCMDNPRFRLDIRGLNIHLRRALADT